MKPFIVGITGGSGSGKTYVLKRIVEKLGAENVCMISQDNYYKDRELQPKDENGVENFDLPESIDLDAFAADLERIKYGEPVVIKEYTYNNKAKEAQSLVIQPKPVVIVEGIFILHHKSVAEALDLKVFLDVKDHIKLKRRILRDQRERGYDLDDVLYRFERHVMPTYEQYIQRHRTDADLVINNNERVNTALDVLVSFLKTKTTAQ